MSLSRNASAPQPTIAAPLSKASQPAFRPPAGSCDSHCHVFGPHARFPYEEQRPYTPHDVSEQTLRAMHDTLGTSRAVIVQAAPHGDNHDALLDALSAGAGSYRGVGLPGIIADVSRLPALDLAGMCGVRFNFMGHLGPLPEWERVVEASLVVRSLQWHVALHLGAAELLQYRDRIALLEGDVVIDHMARIEVSEGLDGAAFQTLIQLLERGNIWVKLSGLDRISRVPWPHEDAVVLARHLAAVAPDRVVWGSDYPHPGVKGRMPDDGKLLDLAREIAPDDERLTRLLVLNPEQIFNFDSGSR